MGQANVKYGRSAFEAGIATALWMVLACRIAWFAWLWFRTPYWLTEYPYGQMLFGSVPEHVGLAVALVILRGGRPLEAVPVAIDAPRHRLHCALVYGVLLVIPYAWVALAIQLHIQFEQWSVFVGGGLLPLAAIIGRWVLKFRSAARRHPKEVSSGPALDFKAHALAQALAPRASSETNNPLLDLPIYTRGSFLVSGRPSVARNIHLDSVQHWPLHGYLTTPAAAQAVISGLRSTLPSGLDLYLAKQRGDTQTPVLIITKTGTGGAAIVVEAKFEAAGSYVQLSTQAQVRVSDPLKIIQLILDVMAALQGKYVDRTESDRTRFISPQMIGDAHGLLQTVLVALQAGGILGAVPRRAASSHEIVK